MDADRDQNSFILLRRGKFKDVREVTSEVMDELKASLGNKIKAPVMNGDLLVLTATSADGNPTKYLLASFHGDTNGLATIPVVTAVYNYAVTRRPDHKLLFGMDANTYAKPEPDQQGVVAFAKFYTSKRLNTCYGPNPNPFNYTTFHARTHLQTQLNKAVSLEEKDSKGDKNPKDFVLFFAADFTVLSTTKDNTGKRKYIENMVFPTLTFPSDHGITSTVLAENLDVIGASSALTMSSEVLGGDSIPVVKPPSVPSQKSGTSSTKKPTHKPTSKPTAKPTKSPSYTKPPTSVSKPPSGTSSTSSGSAKSSSGVSSKTTSSLRAG